MQQQAAPLPPGWTANWHPEYERYSYVDPATGQAQWEEPQVAGNSPEIQGQGSAGRSKGRRQYAASDMYYGADGGPGGAAANFTQPGMPQQQQQQPNASFFSPAAGASPDPYQAQTQPQPGQAAPYVDASNRGTMYQQPPITGITQQFGQMGFAPQQAHQARVRP